MFGMEFRVLINCKAVHDHLRLSREKKKMYVYVYLYINNTYSISNRASPHIRDQNIGSAAQFSQLDTI
jgi:hypothetical protein